MRHFSSFHLPHQHFNPFAGAAVPRSHCDNLLEDGIISAMCRGSCLQQGPDSFQGTLFTRSVSGTPASDRHSTLVPGEQHQARFYSKATFSSQQFNTFIISFFWAFIPHAFRITMWQAHLTTRGTTRELVPVACHQRRNATSDTAWEASPSPGLMAILMGTAVCLSSQNFCF